jgi:hypothetical protein
VAPHHLHRVTYAPGLQEQLLGYLHTGCACGPSALYTARSSVDPVRAAATRAAGDGAPPGVVLRDNLLTLWDALDGRDQAGLLGGLVSTFYADLVGERLPLPADDAKVPVELFESRRPRTEGEDEDEDEEAARRLRARSEERAKQKPLFSDDPKLFDSELREAWAALRGGADSPGERQAEGSAAGKGPADGEGQPLGFIQRAIRWALHNPIETCVIVASVALLTAVIVRNPGQAREGGAG